jgi:hypothetical protein
VKRSSPEPRVGHAAMLFTPAAAVFQQPPELHHDFRHSHSSFRGGILHSPPARCPEFGSTVLVLARCEQR